MDDVRELANVPCWAVFEGQYGGSYREHNGEQIPCPACGGRGSQFPELWEKCPCIPGLEFDIFHMVCDPCIDGDLKHNEDCLECQGKKWRLIKQREQMGVLVRILSRSDVWLTAPDLVNAIFDDEPEQALAHMILTVLPGPHQTQFT